MAVSQIVKNNIAGQIRLIDGSLPTPLEYVCAFERGDFAFSGGKEVLNNPVAIERRGKFVNALHGGRVYPSFTFSAWASSFQDDGAEPGNIATWVLRSAGGAYEAAVSTFGPGSRVPFAFHVEYTMSGLDYNDGADHTFQLGDCEITDFSFTEAEDGNTFQLSGIVRGPITGDLPMSEVP